MLCLDVCIRAYFTVHVCSENNRPLSLPLSSMDVAVYPTHLTYRVIGGILDLSFFGGPGPEQVVRQYQQVIGALLPAVYFVYLEKIQ